MKGGRAGPSAAAKVVVSRVGEAKGSTEAAAALACAGSQPDRAALLVELTEGRPPRPALVASAAARRLEERLAAHLPGAGVAARGALCHLVLPPDADGFGRVPAALALVRDSLAVVDVPPALLTAAIEPDEIGPEAVLLRADLDLDRSLAALAVRELIARGISVAIAKQPLAWVPSRRAMFGVLPAGAPGGLSSGVLRRLAVEAPA